MVSIPAIKKKITSVINEYGNDITIRTPGTKTFDDWGEPIYTGGSDVDTIGVTDIYYDSTTNLTSAGKTDSSTLTLLINGDEVVDDDFIIIIDNTEYNILNIEVLKVSNITVAYNMRLGSK